MTIAASIFEADIAEAAGDLSESITFMGNRSKVAIVISDALVGDVPVTETGRLDGDLDQFTVSIVVKKSACVRAPFIGELVTLASGRVVRIQSVLDDPSGSSYPIQAIPESNA